MSKIYVVYTQIIQITRAHVNKTPTSYFRLNVKSSRVVLRTYTSIGVGDPITLMDSDPLITFMKVIVTFYPLLWIRLLVSFIAICTQLD